MIEESTTAKYCDENRTVKDTITGTMLVLAMLAFFATSAALVVGNCAERMYGDDAPSLSFQGPLPRLTLSSAQIEMIKHGIAESLKDPASASFGRSYRAAMSSEDEIVACGYVNGKSFVGMFATPEGGSEEFLPIRVAESEEQQPAVREYCRADGIYVPK